MSPSGPGGTQRAISATPATRAGVVAHEHGRGIAGPSSGRVAAGPVDRAHQVADGQAAGHVVVGRWRSLVGVVVGDALVGHLEGVAQRSGDAVEGDLEVGLGDPELVDLHAVEGSGEAAKGAVAVGAHLGDDGGHLGRGPVLLVDRGGQGHPQRPAVASMAAEVDATKGHSQAMVPDHLPTSALDTAHSQSPRDRCHAGPMATTAAELSSLATAVDEITRRITTHAEAADAEKDEEMASELFAIERSLTTANRRLARLTVALSRRSA